MAASPYDRTVRELLSREVVCADPEDSGQDALNLMLDHRLSAMPVQAKNGQCVGMFSVTDLVIGARDLGEALGELADGGPDPDLLQRLGKHNIADRKVEEIMSRDVVSIAPQDSLVSAAREMLRCRVHRLPVVDEKNKILGVLSMTDIMEAFVDGAPA